MTLDEFEALKTGLLFTRVEDIDMAPETNPWSGAENDCCRIFTCIFADFEVIGEVYRSDPDDVIWCESWEIKDGVAAGPYEVWPDAGLRIVLDLLIKKYNQSYPIGNSKNLALPSAYKIM